MNESFYTKYLRPALVLTVICLVVTAAVVAAYHLTKPYIDAASNAAADAAAKTVLPEVQSFSDFETDIDFSEKYGCTFLRKASDNSAVAVQIETRGYQSGLYVMVGIHRDGTVSAVRVVKHSETENVGTRAMSEEYLSAYEGKRDTEDITAMSGATYTSEGIKTAVDKALLLFDEIKEGLS